MKKIIIKLSLIILCTQLSLFSMDQTITPSQEQVMARISHDICVKYGSNPAHNDLFYGIANMITQLTLTPAQSLDIMKIVEQHYARNTALDLPDTFNKLYIQNSFFKSAIDELTKFADDNLKLLTANNITTIENPTKQQPTPLLNELSLPIKKYVMNRALKKINYTYDIVLSGQHQDPIQAFDICELTDQAVTSSFKKKPTTIEEIVTFTWPNDKQQNWNNIFLLWDLKTGKPIKKFNEQNPINIVAFSPDGSLIAAAMYNENTVKIWCPKTNQLLHTLSSHDRIDNLVINNHLLTAIYNNNASITKHIITQWALKTDYNSGQKISCFHAADEWGEHGHRTKHSQFYGNKYRAIPPLTYLTSKKNELTITKRDCNHVLMCLQAIQKTDTSLSNPQDKIEKSSSFQQSTSWERGMIYTAIQRKQYVDQKDKKLELKVLNQ